jgi:isocitrate/isopropylmalate dehydrogenase
MKKKYKIGIIPGDGIGKDVIRAAKIVLETVNTKAKEFYLDFLDMDVGEPAVEKYGNPFPKETIDGIKQTNAVLFGAVGNPYTATVLNGIRIGFDLYAKVCPIKSLPGIDVIRPQANFIIVRENTEGLYRGTGFMDGEYYVNLRIFTKKGIERIIRFSFELAIKEKRERVTFAHKAPALKYTDEPMRKMFYKIAEEYPNIKADDMMVDACAMSIIMKPERFDIILTENANGDILSDIGAAIIGGLGLAYSGNIGESMAVFEPIHGNAPKYADKNIVNPIAAILAGKMMLSYLGEIEAASKIEKAVNNVLIKGKIRTYDLGGTSTTLEVAEAICNEIVKNWI